MGIRWGKATIVFHAALVPYTDPITQEAVQADQSTSGGLGNRVRIFTTFCNYLATFLPSTDNIAMRIVLMLVSTVF